MVKDGVVVIDVGITRVPDETKEKGYVITGDVDFENVSKKQVLLLFLVEWAP
jgi:methylenetetrahydrofolate dehydrogenase (NADP+)/methenyltetrahydrofolate cyclohydrolase